MKLTWVEVTFILLLIVLVCLCTVSSYQDVGEYKCLSDNIKEIEGLIGDYSEYYVMIDKDKNHIIHSISGIETEGGCITLVIPSNMDTSNIILDFYTCWDEMLKSYSCDFEAHGAYCVKGKEIKLLQSDLQFVFIDVLSKDLKRVNDSFREEINPKKESADVVVSTQDISIRGKLKPRGASTWNLYKKLPYNLKLSRHLNLFNLGVDKKWNLLANASDKTLLKNEIFYDMSRRLRLKYTPKIKNINLFFNDSYQGVYSVSTKVNVGKNKVNLSYGDFLINWQAPNYNIKIDYECGFFVGAEEGENPYVDLVYPEAVNSDYEGMVKDKVQEYVNCLEFKNDRKLEDIVDLESFAKYYWVQEISMNVDAWCRSYYMYYKNCDDKLYAGPVWDMEWTLGADLGYDGVMFDTPEGWKVRRRGCYQQMFRHKDFVDEVNRVYYDYNLESLMYEMYNEYLKRSEDISDIGELNYLMHKDENRYSDIVRDDKSYKDFVKAKTDFYKARIDWISENMRFSYNK